MAPQEWQEKQDYFLKFLQKHGADLAPYRVDLDKKLIYWVDDYELSLVVADCRVLLSYALSNRSVMMSWANRSLAKGSGIEPVEDLEDLYTDCEPEHVWELTMFAASAAGAQAIYRTPSPQSWVMLGLWNLRPGGREQFTSGSPKSHIVQVVTSLLNHPDFEERQVLLDNYAESFLQMASHPYKHTNYQSLLKDAARTLRNLLIYQREEELDFQNKALQDLLSAWQALQE